MKTTLFILSTILLTSCTIHKNTISGGNGVALVGQQVATRSAHGATQTIHFLGLGGLKREALLLEARMNMLDNYPLRKNEVIGQTIVDVKKFIFLPISTQKVIITADYLSLNEFDSVDAQAVAEPAFDADFVPGETVIFWSQGSYIEVSYAFGTGNSHYVYTENKTGNKELTKASSQRVWKKIDLSNPQNVSELANLFPPIELQDTPIIFSIDGVEKKADYLQKSEAIYWLKMLHKNGKEVIVLVPKAAIKM